MQSTLWLSILVGYILGAVAAALVLPPAAIEVVALPVGIVAVEGSFDPGDAVEVLPDELPVFWACGVTPQAQNTGIKPSGVSWIGSAGLLGWVVHFISAWCAYSYAKDNPVRS